MPRPYVYDTAKEAAEHNLYSKLRGSAMALSLEEFLDIVTSKCSICGMTPDQTLVVKRADDKHILHHHFIHNGETVCRMCRALAKDYGIKIILRHAARIMAKRMHDKRRKYKMKAQLEDMIDNWVK